MGDVGLVKSDLGLDQVNYTASNRIDKVTWESTRDMP